MTTPHHTSITTDYQPQIIVQPAEDPQWFPMLAWLHRSGLYPRLPQTPRDMIEVLCWQRWEQRRAHVHATIDQLANWLGLRSPKAAYDAVRFLLEPPADIIAITGHPARLLAKHGPTVWEPLPGRRFASRATMTGDSPQSETGPPRFTLAGRFLPQSESVSGDPARAPTTQIKTVVRSKPERSDRISDAALARWIKARESGMGGWAGFPLWWSLDGVTCPTLALTMLDVRTFVRTDLLAIVDRSGQPLTVAEIAAQVEQIRMDRSVRNPPVVLAIRLARSRGGEIDTVRRARQREQRRDDTLNRLREIRHNEARQRAGGAS